MIMVPPAHRHAKVRAPSMFLGGLAGVKRRLKDVTFPLPVPKNQWVPGPKTYRLRLSVIDADRVREAQSRHEERLCREE